MIMKISETDDEMSVGLKYLYIIRLKFKGPSQTLIYFSQCYLANARTVQRTILKIK
jgi:hypothetical protein